MLGPIVGQQTPLKRKYIPTITKLHEFRFNPDEEGAVVRQVCTIGPGQPVEIAPIEVNTEYKGEVKNKHHLNKNGQPLRRTAQRMEKTTEKAKTKEGEKEKIEKKFTMYDHIRKAYINAFGMETLEDLQPDVDTDGKILLQRLEKPHFTEKLLEIAVGTKRSPLGSTLQQNLRVGFALPVWGDGKNAPTKKAKEFIAEIFKQGQLSKPVPAADVVKLMQQKVDPITQMPDFDETTFLDEDQIKGIFGNLSRQGKRRIPASKSGANAIVGIDVDDPDNGKGKQEFEEALENQEALDQDAAMDQDASRIQSHLEDNIDDSDECPITVAGENLCNIAENIQWGFNTDRIIDKLSKKQKDAIFDKVEGDDDMEAPGKRRTKRRLKDLIFSYVKRNCTCCTLNV